MPHSSRCEPWTGAAFFSLDGIPVVEAMKSHWRQIRDEYLAARTNTTASHDQYPLDIAIGTWLVTSLRTNEVEYAYMTDEVRRRAVGAILGPSAQDLSADEINRTFVDFCERQMAENRLHHPTVTGILDEYHPHSCVNYNFSLMQPGVVLTPHRGLDAGNIRAHLCLIEDAGCFLDVAGKIRSWRDGEVFAFDDHNVHWAAHRGERDRLVLIVDFTKDFLHEELKYKHASESAAAHEPAL